MRLILAFLSQSQALISFGIMKRVANRSMSVSATSKALMHFCTCSENEIHSRHNKTHEHHNFTCYYVKKRFKKRFQFSTDIGQSLCNRNVPQ